VLSWLDAEPSYYKTVSYMLLHFDHIPEGKILTVTSFGDLFAPSFHRCLSSRKVSMSRCSRMILFVGGADTF
jgi:hypothetical protein